MTTGSTEKRRVCVIGAGSAGMAAAWSLSRFPEKYHVTVIEPGSVCGGVACSLQHSYTGADGQKQTVPVNYGVQGGSAKAHQNTIELMREFGLTPTPCELTVSFGKGGHNWKNYDRSEMQKRLRAETKRFGRLMRWISRLEFVSIFVSIDFVLRRFGFSEDFRFRMVFPLVALFFGTGNQTPNVSAAIVARVFRDKSMAIFKYHEEFLLDETPENIAFHELEAFYEAMRKRMEAGGAVHFRMQTRAVAVNRRAQGGAKVVLAPAPQSWRAGLEQGGPPAGGGLPQQPKEVVELEVLECDELIMACPANVALAMLKDPSAVEKSVLSSVEYFRDLSVTHTDAAYMRKHNEVDGKAIYFIKTLDEKPQCIEMGFDLSGYQPDLQLPELQAEGQRVYQTIYLDERAKADWTIEELDKGKVLDQSWWCAFSHTYKHFRNVVPWVWRLQRPGRTLYAGSWTLFNTHDIAIASGFAAAARLGAPFPFPDNELAANTFHTVLMASHLKRRGASPTSSYAGSATKAPSC